MRASALFALLMLAAAPAAAEDCPRGALDKAYCDRDGDMVADAPTDPKQYLDPSTLIFSYTPIEDPAVWQGIWARFLTHLEKTVGRPVKFFQIQSYAAQLEALRSGRLHVVGVNAGSVPLAVNCAGYVPMVGMATPKGLWGYTMEFIVPAKSKITQVSELRGKEIAFVSPTSHSGYKAPLVFLRKQGLELDRDYKARFTGKHDTSILGVANGDFDIAAVAGDLVTRMGERKVFDPAQVRVIYTSELFPGTGYGVSNRLKPELAEKVKQAFLTYDWQDPGLRHEFPDVDRFSAIDYKSRWEIFREVDAETGVKYDCK